MPICFIPTKLEVGFQKRSDTFTGLLSYIIYHDEKGVLRKETSWKSWKDNSIDVLSIDNTPLTGYIINKGVRRSSDWCGSGRTMVRIHDPRGFEFEITHQNLMQLLMHSNVSHRDIQQECILAWIGTELVLMPTNSEEYTNSVKYTDNRKSPNVKAKELVLGNIYGVKNDPDEFVVYLGYHLWYQWDSDYQHDNVDYKRKCVGKKHIFYNLQTKEIEKLVPTKLVAAINTDIHDEFATMVDEWWKGINSTPGINIHVDLTTINPPAHVWHTIPVWKCNSPTNYTILRLKLCHKNTGATEYPDELMIDITQTSGQYNRTVEHDVEQGIIHYLTVSTSQDHYRYHYQQDQFKVHPELYQDIKRGFVYDSRNNPLIKFSDLCIILRNHGYGTGSITSDTGTIITPF